MKKKISILLVVSMLISMLISCVPPSPAPQTWGELENPKEGSTLSGTYIIKGWYFNNLDSKKISIYVDDNLDGEQEINVTRKDIVSKYNDVIQAGVQSGAITLNAVESA